LRREVVLTDPVRRDEEEERRAQRDPKKKGNPKKLPKSLRKKASQLKKF